MSRKYGMDGYKNNEMHFCHDHFYREKNSAFFSSLVENYYCYYCFYYDYYYYTTTNYCY